MTELEREFNHVYISFSVVKPFILKECFTHYIILSYFFVIKVVKFKKGNDTLIVCWHCCPHVYLHELQLLQQRQ